MGTLARLTELQNREENQSKEPAGRLNPPAETWIRMTPLMARTLSRSMAPLRGGDAAESFGGAIVFHLLFGLLFYVMGATRGSQALRGISFSVPPM